MLFFGTQTHPATQHNCDMTSPVLTLLRGDGNSSSLPTPMGDTLNIHNLFFIVT